MRSHARMLLTVVCFLLLVMWAQGQTAVPAALAAGNQREIIVEGYGKLPLVFEANQGQSNSRVKFLSRGAGYSLFLTPAEAVLTLQPSALSKQQSAEHQPAAPAVLRMKLRNANPRTEVSGQDALPGRSNYFIGNDPKKWHTDVRHYAKVRYANVYPGVDLMYYGNQRQLEYDFVLQPGANPEQIRLGIEGASKLRLEHGDLVLTSAAGDVHLRSPHVYQQSKGRKTEIHGGYAIRKNNEVGFRVATYDRRRTLIIDPVLAYSTYLSGNGDDVGARIAVDAVGNAYVGGWTSSTDFPIVNAIQSNNHGPMDAFVTKINADGTALIYSTYLGGSGDDANSREMAIAVDSAGCAYVAGATHSNDFPTINAFQPTNHGGYEAFLAKINAGGNALIYSTYLGGSDDDLAIGGVAVDAAGNAYLTGNTASNDFPIANAIQPTNHGGSSFDGSARGDAFVTKINASGTALVYSTYLGGTGEDVGQSIAVDSFGSVYLTGFTGSFDFPVANAIQPTSHGGAYYTRDAFVTKINAAGSAFVYSTYLGGGWDDYGWGIAVDQSGNAYVTGQVASLDFPEVNALQPCQGGWKAFVSKFNADGSAFIYSTCLNGSDGSQGGGGIAVDRYGNAYISGHTSSSDFPAINAIQPTNHGGRDAFVTELNPDGSAFVYSTYLGGSDDDQAYDIAVDSVGSAYVTGYTALKSLHFPITPLAFQQSRKGSKNKSSADGFVAKIAPYTFVSVSPLKLTFSTQAIGTTSGQKKVTLNNEGAGTLTINNIYFMGKNPGDFADTTNCPTTLAAGATCAIWVTFTPTAKNARKAMLVISDSDPSSPQGVALTGTGTFVSLSAKSVSFGRVQVGTTSSPKTVTLTNVGSALLNFNDISISGTNGGDFSQTNTCGAGIDAGANCTITMTFTPTAAGTRKAVVSISDDGGGSPQKITLSGTGT